MDIYVQLLINSLQISAVYVLFSLGLTLIFGVMRIVNFAHGEFFALAALLIAVAVPWLVGLGDGRWLTVSVIGHLLWEKFCKVLGAEDWLADPRFANDELRGKHANLVSERLGAWCA